MHGEAARKTSRRRCIPLYHPLARRHRISHCHGRKTLPRCASEPLAGRLVVRATPGTPIAKRLWRAPPPAGFCPAAAGGPGRTRPFGLSGVPKGPLSGVPGPRGRRPQGTKQLPRIRPPRLPAQALQQRATVGPKQTHAVAVAVGWPPSGGPFSRRRSLLLGRGQPLPSPRTHPPAGLGQRLSLALRPACRAAGPAAGPVLYVWAGRCRAQPPWSAGPVLPALGCCVVVSGRAPAGPWCGYSSG